MADGFVEVGDPNGNYADWNGFVSQSSGTNSSWYSYIKFNITDIPNYTIHESFLVLYTNQSSGDMPYFQVYTCPTNWDETNLTYTNRPTPLDTLVSAYVSPSSSGTATYIDATAVLAAAKAANETELSFMLRCMGTNTWIMWNSREFTGTTGNYNHLSYVVWDVPEASATPTGTPTPFSDTEDTFFSVACPIACVGIPAIIMAVFLGKWGFFSGAALGSAFGAIALPSYVPYYIPLFVGMGIIVVAFLSFRST